MTIDYDLVIIGGSFAGRYAALVATQLKATVALVESEVNYGFAQHQAVSEIGRIFHKINDVAGLGIHTIPANTTAKPPQPLDKCEPSVVWPQAHLYTQEVVSHIAEQNSPANLAALGVDVIFGSGQFQSLPHLAFAVNQRFLRGRSYLLASGSVPSIPEIEGLQTIGYLTLSNIWQSLKQPNLPKNWVIIGGVPQGIEVAQTLAQLGCSVTLAMKSASILPLADSEIAYLLQAQLEANGVRVLTEKPVTQIKLIENKKWVQAGDKAIEADEILLATGQQPNVEFLNLHDVGVKWRQRRLVVNNKLQTTNHRIYACGDVIGGYDFTNVANYEARIAVKNALFFPRFSVNYRPIPWGLNSHPCLAEVGLTEAQAKRQFRRNEVLVLRQYYKSVAAAQLKDEITGVCKLIVLRNGEILGSSILGAEAAELINFIALAIAQKIRVKELANLSFVYPSFSQIIESTAKEWGQHKLDSNNALQDFLEGFFHFRRDWNL
ncbi:dihydrolipoyl dehydrogenase family protein [Umezakia ovalisporum]|jgi:pyruvate/2-oxoglutarate dehydrogenase complex dihydrolipoamide dehydrogenase (E3) component|uniref:NAD(P)/FAD-dependent oxidoreductase n=2 Tax=Umezakia ovalisporum TaxID=75695 RepID=A0AA43H1C3_9CYAN|nr:NAD(P)/FAD-dependent oxidoreductase [Umezakia ovalisporum]MBI1241928.1 mercuric reductase [Nostoc sp. RI_552]MDH6058531.1 NAD(P)/FAD-dependent oxidoreductase [Umezakia ovalisporum FSS-43]MDH6064983.1 NAD(P)/FAD-dependent oxidoreductase [Umezakia ovalisporum FSS-62]MDH6067614.1 NAD(P)/FAD-dependent oxidoreductase [Umezakia ovalisporum APH033B]MDH6069454.1 NAD(P)/FAD-dependent oxidoreductase [Umezakia ovalisporum CobakiLakeA]